jgi:hypothetical protein
VSAGDAERRSSAVIAQDRDRRNFADRSMARTVPAVSTLTCANSPRRRKSNAVRAP